MKTSALTGLLLILLFCISESHARPGKFGGGGGVGGGFHPRPRPTAPVVHPRPPSGPKPGTFPVKNPGGIGGVKPIPRPPIAGGGPGMIKPNPKPGFPGKPGTHPGAVDVGKHLGGHPPGHFPGYPGYRPGYAGYHKGEFYRPIHTHFPYHPVYGYPFSKSWCGGFHWHYNRWPYWTTAATAVVLTAWIGAPGYAGYGSASQIPYYPVEPAPPEVYEESVAAPVAAISHGEAAAVGDDAEWMNMGTFGIIPYKATDFAYAVQLATTKDGIVRGIQWDMANNTSAEVAGAIQKDTYRISWQAKVADAFYFDTNVDELTQQESMVNVYDPKTKGLVSWQLIQIEEKDLPPKQ